MENAKETTQETNLLKSDTLFVIGEEPKHIQPPVGCESYSLKELQDFVGGYIQILPLKDKYLVLNEEGKINGLPVNIQATQVWRDILAEDDIVLQDHIVGNALMVDKFRIE